MGPPAAKIRMWTTSRGLSMRAGVVKVFEGAFGLRHVSKVAVVVVKMEVDAAEGAGKFRSKGSLP